MSERFKYYGVTYQVKRGDDMTKYKVGDTITRGTRRFKLEKIAEVKSKKYAMDGIYEHWHRWVKTRKTWSKTPSFYRLRS